MNDTNNAENNHESTLQIDTGCDVLYTCSLSLSLYEELIEHLKNLKIFKKIKRSKNNWIRDAIIEKLTDSEFHNRCLLDARINVDLDKDIKEQIQKRISHIKQFRKSFSMKLWLVEVISQKLKEEAKELDKEKEKHMQQARDFNVK